MLNVLLERLQSAVAKTFNSAEINNRANSVDGNKSKCADEIWILNDNVR